MSIKVLSPTAILGYGFPLASFAAGMDRGPDCLAVDAGSTDPGPYYLGRGVSFVNRLAVKRDLEIMLDAGLKSGIPVLIGSAGGSGARPHLEWCREIILELAREKGWRFKMAVIPADFEPAEVLTAARSGRLKPLEPGPPVNEDEILASTRIAGQMGLEPFLKALDTGVQVILAGRSYDPAVFAAYPIWRGADKALALHAGKILECAAIAAVPGSGSDCMLGEIGSDYFTVEPLNPARRCTVTSVAAHTLYEKTNPYLLPGPGGILDLRAAQFTQDGERRVRVTGSRYNPGPYTIKLEGARRIGYRTVAIAGARDPGFIARVDEIVAGVKARLADNFRDLASGSYSLNFILYGKNGVMGDLEPHPNQTGHELGLVIEAVAVTQELANAICGFARATMLHYGFPGRLCTAGNLALPYSPSDLEAGEVYVFSVYHLLETDDPGRWFPVEVMEVGENG